MQQELKQYLEKRFKQDNLPKYYKYLNDWMNNLTEIQLYYFNIDYIKQLK